MASSGSNGSNMSTAKNNDHVQSPCTSSEPSIHWFQRDQSPVSQLGCNQSCFSSNLGRSGFYTTDSKSSNNTSSSSVPTAVTCLQVELDACNLFSCNFQQSRSRNCESLVYDHVEDQQCLALQSPDDLQYLVNFHIYNKRNDQSYQLPQPQNCTKPAALSSRRKRREYLNTTLEKGPPVSRNEATPDANPGGNSNSLEAAISSKKRIRWTQHLHNQFLECVNRLGGAERAKPKLILKLMDVEGLTIFHIKSHLQKCRIAKCIAESREGKPEKNNFDTMPVHDLKT
ncbi:hypothetical protein ACJRO7_007491 [Eucalyptus globulus]|uniref:HTH myb-type domain-containing protein n=1 Tax=Eucalyptus globulus TaxID=34317 RepID=A0ABD3INT8_EUCGL